MIRRYLYLVSALLALVLLCTACGAKKEPGKPETPPAPPAVEQLSEETPQPTEDPTVPEQKEEPVVPEQKEDPAPEAPVFDFAQVANLEFTFSSGAGGWRTVLYINADGSFHGLYTDSEMGDLDETAYPNGTMYICNFSGMFTEPEQVNDDIWRTRVKELTYADPLGEKLEGGFRYVYTEAFGIHGAETVYLYLPGVPLAELPEGYRNWVGYHDLTQTTDTALPFHGLYNESEECGFAAYPLPSAAELVQRELEWAETTAAELEAELQNATTQLDMNFVSSDLYQIWDTALNTIWQQLQRELDEETMAQLTAEQLDWITAKEEAVAAAGGEYEGGSMYALVVNTTAADWTAQRTRELAGLLRAN